MAKNILHELSVAELDAALAETHDQLRFAHIDRELAEPRTYFGLEPLVSTRFCVSRELRLRCPW
ncbi:hypothetical protein CH299_27715 [Rhodococcus sp. 14-2686-1-2]|nr:hypothetical protein CH301_27195 [Rhodococcus sp. 15-1189-1-1a]OZF08480.1 hypothetical protein CH299_27715 [Rhodococcus sp. 14-2686-1-2]